MQKKDSKVFLEFYESEIVLLYEVDQYSYVFIWKYGIYSFRRVPTVFLQWFPSKNISAIISIWAEVVPCNSCILQYYRPAPGKPLWSLCSQGLKALLMWSTIMIQNEDYGISVNSMVLCKYHNIVTVIFYDIFLEVSFTCVTITHSSTTCV